jgi:pimeloyl-ACP methyl ester carboxylesterase
MPRVLALLLHGQPGSSRDWHRLQAALGDRLPTLALDRPGYDGLSPPGGFAHSGAAGLRALDEAGASRAVIVGHSFGAGVAAWLGAHHPERVSALVLVAPAANRQAVVPFDRLLGAPVVGPLCSGAMLFGVSLLIASPHTRRYMARAFAMPEEMLSDSAKRLASRATRQTFVVEQRALLRELPALEADLGRITAPTTIVFGSADAMVPPRAARRLATQIPGATLMEIAGAHHVLPAEHPETLAELLVAAASAG